MNQVAIRPEVNESSLLDKHRRVKKRHGGKVEKSNIDYIEPVDNMYLNGTLREREASLEKLKVLMDERNQLLKMKNSFNNRILAYERRVDLLQESTLVFLKDSIKSCTSELKKLERRIERHMKDDMPGYPIANVALKIKGIGPMTVASILCYVDIHKAQYASSLWAYVGYDKASHERYSKGTAGGGNKTLRTQLFSTAESIIKSRGVYREVYDNEKQKLENSLRITKTRNTQGKLIECAWKDTKPSHRHGAAMRKMIKHFLADLWFVWRELEGLETRPLYVEEKMGHTGIIKPEERGWEY